MKTLKDRVLDIRNTVDFALRKRLSFGFPVEEALACDVLFQNEMREFFSQFDWGTHLRNHPPGGFYKVLDVGARNFSLAPVFRELFLRLGTRPEIHGIEIDAYRRLKNLRTRHDYAVFFTTQVTDSYFHVCDFLEWQKSADCIFAMNPFVTKSPLLAWGLPLKHFRPEAFFEKAAQILSPNSGLLFVTNVDEEEAEVTKQLLKTNFRLLEQHTWSSTVSGDTRIGALYEKGA